MTNLANTIAGLIHLKNERRNATGYTYDYPSEAIDKLINELCKMNETQEAASDRINPDNEEADAPTSSLATIHHNLTVILQLVSASYGSGSVTYITLEQVVGELGKHIQNEKEERQPDAHSIAGMVEITSRVMTIYGANIRNEAVLHPNPVVAEALYTVARAFDNADLALRRGASDVA